MGPASIVPIVYIFIVLVVAYITIGFRKVPPLDIMLITFALLIVVFTLIRKHFTEESVKEHFLDPEEIDFSKMKPIVLEEDITSIKRNLVVYNTAFNKVSYNDGGNSWLNMVVTNKDGSCNTDADNSAFNFELPPVFSRKSGFYMGNNRLVGPYCNALNIQFHNTFTIVLACKHGNLLVDQSNEEIEILKFYANSPNNNGISLYIQRGSLRNVNNVQMGKLMLQYSSRVPFQCKMKESHDLISFEKDLYTLYFIVKDTDHIRVAVMTEKNNNIDEILRFNVENTDVTFANKEFVMNRLKNWNGNVYNFGVFNVALTDDDITGLHAHMLGEYMKYVNPNYIGMIEQYNDTLSLLAKFMACPYDKAVCDTCSTVTKWNSMEQLVTASAQCRNAINAFCMANMNHPLCKCWNTQNTAYKTDTCKMFRGVFSDKNGWLEGLSQDEIDFIMKKYGLIRPEDCPKPISKPDMVRNKYSKYDFEKLKVKLADNEGNRSGNVLKVYEAESDLPQDEEYQWNKLKITLNENNKPHPKAAKMQNKDLEVKNFYKKDADVNYKVNENPLAKEYEKIKGQTKLEQEKLKKTDDLNIVPDKKFEVPTDRVVNYHKDLLGTTVPSTKPVEQPKQKGDTFFTRFMQVALPS
jgi:hypothetical protein